MKNLNLRGDPPRSFMRELIVRDKPSTILAAGRVEQSYIKTLLTDDLLTAGYTRLVGTPHPNNGYGAMIQAVAFIKGECTIESLFNS